MMITRNKLSNKYFRNIRINYKTTIIIYVVEIRIRNVETRTTKTICYMVQPSPIGRIRRFKGDSF